MFFRRERPLATTYDDRIAGLRKQGFSADSIGAGDMRVSRKGCAAVVSNGANGAEVGVSGILVGSAIGILVDGGYQKFFQTPDGHKYPALASHLTALHEFMEDLDEGLGLETLYNRALGSTCESHMYDRVKDRDRGVPQRSWEK